MLGGLILGITDTAVEDMAKPYVQGLCRHFALLFAAGYGQGKKPAAAGAEPAGERCIKVMCYVCLLSKEHRGCVPPCAALCSRAGRGDARACCRASSRKLKSSAPGQYMLLGGAQGVRRTDAVCAALQSM